MAFRPNVVQALALFIVVRPGTAVSLRNAGEYNKHTAPSAVEFGHALEGALLSEEQSDAPSWESWPSGLPVVQGRYLYLSQGPAEPPAWLVHVASRPESDGIFLVYTRQPPAERFKAVYTFHVPGTIWSTGRNALYERAKAFQVAQGWRYEYLIFADEDAGLRHPVHDPYAVWHSSLSFVQPAVAAVGLPGLPRNNCSLAPCTGDFDAAINAFHATAAPIFLPYDPVFDKHSWWNSQAIVIELLMASAPEYSVQFNQVSLADKNTHANYPRKMTYFRRQGHDKYSHVADYLRAKVNRCLRDRVGMSEVSSTMGSGCHRCSLTEACSDGSPFCDAFADTPAPAPDYGQLIRCKPYGP